MIVIKFIDNGDRRLDTPAIIGERRTPTPSGIFSLINSGNGTSSPEMEFYYDATGVYLVHALTRGRDRSILERNPKYRRLSAGCINLSKEMLNEVLNYARDIFTDTICKNAF